MSKSGSGATDGVRTRGIGHHKPALYRLSYSRHQIQLARDGSLANVIVQIRPAPGRCFWGRLCGKSREIAQICLLPASAQSIDRGANEHPGVRDLGYIARYCDAESAS